MSLRPFPDVPDDIVRLILEETVEGDYYSAFQLVLVAKHVQRWIDPLAYRVIKINSAKALSAICHTITSSIRPAKFFVDHVKILAIDVDDAEDINPLVAACPGIHSFASRRSRRLSPGLLDLHLNLRLLYLDILEYIYEQSMNAFDGLNIPLSRLTHLYVDALFYDTSYHRRLLELTPCLTHLCILCGLADPNIIDATPPISGKSLAAGSSVKIPDVYFPFFRVKLHRQTQKTLFCRRKTPFGVGKRTGVFDRTSRICGNWPRMLRRIADALWPLRCDYTLSYFGAYCIENNIDNRGASCNTQTQIDRSKCYFQNYRTCSYLRHT
ncbi:hypothetical protein C8J56DRAFT_1041953 [Mycena floridula]|nr:hypothetical protein C8J56DRAFT_1041953 [Mycena floridula]